MHIWNKSFWKREDTSILVSPLLVSVDVTDCPTIHVVAIVYLNEDNGIVTAFQTEQTPEQKRIVAVWHALIASSNLLIKYPETQQGLDKIEEFLQEEGSE